MGPPALINKEDIPQVLPILPLRGVVVYPLTAVPLTVGYAVARIRSRRRRDDGDVDLDSAIDSAEVWLAAAACLMLGALLVTMSRSGITAAAAALLALVWMSRGRIERGRRSWLLVGIAALVAGALAYANTGALLNRVGEALTAGAGSRREIWRETWVMVEDFRLTGVGVGA